MNRLLMFAFIFVLALSAVSAWQKTYDPETKTMLIESDAGVDLVRITLEYNSYVCGYECEALLKWEVLVDGLSSPVSPFKVKKFINNNWVDDSMTLSFQHNTSGDWGPLTYSQFNTGLANSGTYFMKIKGYKDPSETYDWIPSMFSGTMDLEEWAVWGAINVYDEIDDSFYNMSLWSNYSTNEAQTSVVEDTDYLSHTMSTTSTSWITGYIQADEIDLTDVSNVTFRLNAGVSSGFCDAGSAGYANLSIFGVNVNNEVDGCASGGGDSLGVNDWSTWTAYRNESGTNKWHIYDDGVYLQEITATNNDIYVAQGIRMYGGNSGNSYANFYYVYYSYDDWVMNITLDSPQDNSNVVNGNQVVFGATVNDTLDTLVNMTFYINGVANETKSLSGSYDSETFTKVADASWNNWSVYVCDDGVNCKMSDVYTINSDSLVEDSLSFSASAFEGSTQNFIAYTTFDSSTYPNIDAALYYNGTRYAATKSTSGDSANFSVSLDIPFVSATTNLSLYWNYTLLGSSTVYFIGETNNQSVTNFNIDDCSSYTEVLLNYTLYDEDTQTVIDGAALNGSIEIDIDIYSSASSTPVIEYSQLFSNTNNATICIESGLGTDSYTMDVETKYSASGYQIEYNNLQSYSLSGSSMYQNISLYDLSTSTATPFTITFKDDAFIPVAGALIDITRSYVSEGTFKTIEKPLTDTNGRAVASLREDDTIYTLSIYKDGELLAVFNDVYAICQDSGIGQCEINLNQLSTVTIPQDFTNEGNLYYTLTYDEDTRTITSLFSKTDGSSANMQLSAYVYDAYINITMCSDSVTSSSGTLTCVIPAEYTNTTAIVYLTENGVIVQTAVILLLDDPIDSFGGSAYVMVLAIMSTLPLMFISSPIGIMVGIILGMILSGLLIFTTGGNAISVGVSVVWLIVAAVLVIWQLNSRSRGGA